MSTSLKNPRLVSLRWDGLFWRRIAYLASVHGPEWWKRIMVPLVGLTIFVLIGRNRGAVVNNLRHVLGSRGWWADHWAALKTFTEFSWVFEENFEMEANSAHGRALVETEKSGVQIEWPEGFDPLQVLEPGRGLIVLTSHFGSWEIGARVMQGLERPVNLVMATEANESVENFSLAGKERHGLRVIHSNKSLFSSVDMVRALRRGEIVAIQLDRSAPGQVTEDVEFFGEPAPFQLGPFALARTAGVPIWPVYVARVGRHRFRFLPEPLRRIDRRADRGEVCEVMREVVSGFESRVREYPFQWFQFHRVWPDAT